MTTPGVVASSFQRFPTVTDVNSSTRSAGNNSNGFSGFGEYGNAHIIWAVVGIAAGADDVTVNISADVGPSFTPLITNYLSRDTTPGVGPSPASALLRYRLDVWGRISPDLTTGTVTVTKAGATISGTWRIGQMQAVNASGFVAQAVGGGADVTSLVVPSITTTVPYVPTITVIKGSSNIFDTATDSYNFNASNGTVPVFTSFRRSASGAGTSAAPTATSPSTAGQAVGFHVGFLGRA